MNWWVIPEGFAGQLISGFSLQGPALHLYTVKQSNVKPPGAVAGPFSSQQEAQTQADSLNKTGVATPGNIGKQAVSSALTSANPFAGFYQQNLWLRVGEFVLGVLLIGVGLAKLTGTENFVSSVVKKAPI